MTEENKQNEELQSQDAIENHIIATEPKVQPKSSASGVFGWVVSGVLLILLILVATLSYAGDDKGENVASVNGKAITEKQLYDALLLVKGGGQTGQQKMSEVTLDDLINVELMDQELQKQGLVVGEADIDKELEALKQAYGLDDEKLKQTLAQNGMTVDDLRPDLEKQAKLRKLLSKKADVTDKDIQDYYDQNKQSFATPEQVRASHILVKTKEEADAILKQLKDGADFATVAKEKSEDPGSKDAGGDLNYFGKGQMDPAFEKAAFELKVGETSQPVQSSFGYHIIKVTDHKAAANPTFEEKKEEIKNILMMNKINELAQPFIEELKSKAKIENSLVKEDKPEDAATAPKEEATTVQ
ncbi:peptidylprolyl isomerase [Paenibacillus sp. MMS18-CY102]|uniref:peptidylprolyl isomerase n=1 Tax=Paenibacillus sp. MMS18-CY102 TaxID=2682849 RepID=UPI0013657405|nr:peptidylprolyl isomerase [Paenibacillus sp. MMS18-CY102]MWC30993.1 peptidylprolyl isomerase [Paenibacillus sp. MMS18-CY102]